MQLLLRGYYLGDLLFSKVYLVGHIHHP